MSEADRLRLLEAGRKVRLRVICICNTAMQLLEERRRAPQPRSTSAPSPAPVPAATSPAQLSVAPSVPVTSVPSLLGSSSGDDEARLRAKTAAQNKRIDQLTAENKDLVARIDQLERNTLEICSENNAQRSRLDDALKRCRHLEEENSQLRSELRAPPPVDELAILQRELDEKTSTARDLQRRLAQSETTATQRARTIDALDEDVRHWSFLPLTMPKCYALVLITSSASI